MPSVLFIGDVADERSTAYQKSKAWERTGFAVRRIDTSEVLPPGNIWNRRLHAWTGFALTQSTVRRNLKSLLGSRDYSLIWVDSGAWCGPSVAKLLKEHTTNLLLYNHDDPTGERDGNRWLTLKKAIPHFDYLIAVRRETYDDFIELGARNVGYFFRTYDEVFHSAPVEPVPDHLQSEVCFIGTHMENRDRFLLSLVQLGVPLSIWGNAWHRSRYWSALRNHWKGGALYGKDYTLAIKGAKVCLGLLSKQNRDLHTTRSSEIPYTGGAFCAPRTLDHEFMFRNGKDAMLWDSAEECADQCRFLLGNDNERERLMLSGGGRVRELRLGNEDLCNAIWKLLKFCRPAS